MRAKRSWLLRGVVLGGVALTLAAPALGSDGTEFVCEEAVSHLDNCCPGFDPQAVDCTYDFIDCGSNDDPNPQLSRPQAECIERLDCEEIVAGGYCERVMNGEAVSCE